VLAPVFAGLAAGLVGGLVGGLVAGLAGCTSKAAREREQPAEARRNVADENRDVQAKDVQAKEVQAKEVQAKDVPAQEVRAQESSGETDRALRLREQEKLDATEQKSTHNVYAHSCRKVTLASYALKASKCGHGPVHARATETRTGRGAATKQHETGEAAVDGGFDFV